MNRQNISATIDNRILKKIDAVAAQTERTRSWLITKALESYLEEFEDIQIAKERLHETRLDSSQLRKVLGVSD